MFKTCTCLFVCVFWPVFHTLSWFRGKLTANILERNFQIILSHSFWHKEVCFDFFVMCNYIFWLISLSHGWISAIGKVDWKWVGLHDFSF